MAIAEEVNVAGVGPDEEFWREFTVQAFEAGGERRVELPDQQGQQQKVFHERVLSRWKQLCQLGKGREGSSKRQTNNQSLAKLITSRSMQSAAGAEKTELQIR